MKTVSLSGSPRGGVGKKDAKLLRVDGQVPCVVYGGKEQVHFSIKELAIERIVNTSDVYLIELEAGAFKGNAIIQDIQYHPVTDRVLHVDFLEAEDGKELKISLPVRLEGNSVGVRNGGRLSFPAKRLAIKGVPTDLPSEIVVQTAEVKIGDSIRIADLDYPKLRFLASDESVIMGVRMSRGAIEDEEGEGEEGAEGAEGAEGGDAPAGDAAEKKD